MIFVNKKIFLLILILLPDVYPQGNDELQKQFEYAGSLFNEEKFYDAITEFKRLQFFDSGKEYTFSSNQMIAQSYKNGGKLNEAVYYFSLAEQESKTLKDLYNIKIEIIKANILRRTTGRALQLLNEIENDKRFTGKTDEINYWRGWVYIFSDNWDEASEYFGLIDSNHELKIFCKDVSDSKYSVTFAKIISAILPGTGQFYTGNFISGFLSLGWNVLWGYFSVNAFLEDRVFDGIMVANFLWLRFYSGNIHNAGKFAEERNLNIVNDALYHLQNYYKGLKP
jgi:hypothetical protein